MNNDAVNRSELKSGPILHTASSSSEVVQNLKKELWEAEIINRARVGIIHPESVTKITDETI